MEANLRMKEIVERTGENKSTILHYIHLGLLPEPLRTSKNMAYYPESYIELLNIIRTLQNRFFLPLHAIKRILIEPYMCMNFSIKMNTPVTEVPTRYTTGRTSCGRPV